MLNNLILADVQEIPASFAVNLPMDCEDRLAAGMFAIRSSISLGTTMPEPGMIGAISKVPVKISVRLCRQSMKLQDLANLAPGDCLSFQSSSDAPLELHAHNQVLAKGESVRHGDRVGLRITARADH
jgi:flagellar motor switch/type III secretory pathway protein FliN